MSKLNTERKEDAEASNQLPYVNYFVDDLHDAVGECFHSCFDDSSNCIGVNKKTLSKLYDLQFKVNDLVDQVEENFNLKLD